MSSMLDIILSPWGIGWQISSYLSNLLHLTFSVCAHNEEDKCIFDCFVASHWYNQKQIWHKCPMVCPLKNLHVLINKITLHESPQFFCSAAHGKTSISWLVWDIWACCGAPYLTQQYCICVRQIPAKIITLVVKGFTCHSIYGLLTNVWSYHLCLYSFGLFCNGWVCYDTCEDTLA